MYNYFSWKKASIDGSVMISRNDDTAGAITPQKFIIEPAAHGEKGRKIKSWLNKFEMDLPEMLKEYRQFQTLTIKS
jgi:dipeptidase